MEASKREDFVRNIHEKTKELIEKKGKSNAARVNKKRKEMYEEEPNIARGAEEQLDMVLDVKTIHGRAREEREACTKEEEVTGTADLSGPTLPARAPGTAGLTPTMSAPAPRHCRP
ncbi:hypothetical protein QYE76_005696 [Lolium multiflorum]|uniref:Uncharacterized protein n=1 Tax=Lolium multiflorum TaxID=4521 RepID=A0AAD8W3N5_LOLMU|nr:hypothetical protein QYE76_005696 [Lolium multiflorum]